MTPNYSMTSRTTTSIYLLVLFTTPRSTVQQLDNSQHNRGCGISTSSFQKPTPESQKSQECGIYSTQRDWCSLQLLQESAMLSCYQQHKVVGLGRKGHPLVVL